MNGDLTRWFKPQVCGSTPQSSKCPTEAGVNLGSRADVCAEKNAPARESDPLQATGPDIIPCTIDPRNPGISSYGPDSNAATLSLREFLQTTLDATEAGVIGPGEIGKIIGGLSELVSGVSVDARVLQRIMPAFKAIGPESRQEFFDSSLPTLLRAWLEDVESATSIDQRVQPLVSPIEEQIACENDNLDLTNSHISKEFLDHSVEVSRKDCFLIVGRMLLMCPLRGEHVSDLSLHISRSNAAKLECVILYLNLMARVIASQSTGDAKQARAYTFMNEKVKITRVRHRDQPSRDLPSSDTMASADTWISSVLSSSLVIGATSSVEIIGGRTGFCIESIRVGHTSDRDMSKRAAELPLASGSNLETLNLKALNTVDVVHDFANRRIGGGTLHSGAVQEEIMFITAPETLVSILLCSLHPMKENESILIENAIKYIDHSGYASSFSCSGYSQTSIDLLTSLGLTNGFDQANENTMEGMIDDSSNDSPVPSTSLYRTSIILCSDAIRFIPDEMFNPASKHARPKSLERSPSCVFREIRKMYSSLGFLRLELPSTTRITLNSGNWGCGVFHGDPRVKFAILIIACTLAGVDLKYYTFDDPNTRELPGIFENFKGKTISELINTLIVQ